jgi:hypothetical protein
MVNMRYIFVIRHVRDNVCWFSQDFVDSILPCDPSLFDITEDPRLDPYDDEDSKLHDHQSLIDASALSVTDAKELGLVPEASADTLQAFIYSKLKLYLYAVAYK